MMEPGEESRKWAKGCLWTIVLIPIALGLTCQYITRDRSLLSFVTEEEREVILKADSVDIQRPEPNTIVDETSPFDVQTSIRLSAKATKNLAKTLNEASVPYGSACEPAPGIRFVFHKGSSRFTFDYCLVCGTAIFRTMAESRKQKKPAPGLEAPLLAMARQCFPNDSELKDLSR